MWFEIIATIFGLFVFIGTLIVIIKLQKKISKKEILPNQPLVENLSRTEFTDGYYCGVLLKNEPRKNGTRFIEFFPLDSEQGEHKPIPKVQSLIVRKEFIKTLPMGEPSSRRQIIKLIGRSPTDMPEQMRDSEEGKWMTKNGQKAWLESTFGKGIQAGDEAIAEAMKDYARGKLPKATLQAIKESNAEFRKIQQSPEQPKK